MTTTSGNDPSLTANPNSLLDMRQNGTADLPDHFSRYGYNSQTRACRNSYCIANHNGRYICGENEVGKGIYADPENMAPQSWYDKKERRENKRYWYPSPPLPLLPGYN
jgi:hypothetical protein